MGSICRARLAGAIAPPARRRGQILEERLGLGPTDAGVRDALTIDQWMAWRLILTPGHQMALDHQPQNPPISRRDLGTDLVADLYLALVVLGAVRVATIDHDARR